MKPRLKKYTVVGYYQDNDQPFVEHIKAMSVKLAMQEVHHKPDDNLRIIVEVFTGFQHGVSGIETTSMG